jgi:hypothetical protein
LCCSKKEYDKYISNDPDMKLAANHQEKYGNYFSRFIDEAAAGANGGKKRIGGCG